MWIRDLACGIGILLGIVKIIIIVGNYLYQAISIFIIIVTMCYYIREIYLQMKNRKDCTIDPS